MLTGEGQGWNSPPLQDLYAKLLSSPVIWYNPYQLLSGPVGANDWGYNYNDNYNLDWCLLCCYPVVGVTTLI